MGQPYSIFDKNLPARVALGGAGYYVGGRLIGAAPSPVETAVVAVSPFAAVTAAGYIEKSSSALGLDPQVAAPAGAALASFAFARSPAQAALAAATTFGAYKALDAK